jgi:hypothetical protein
MLPITTPLKGFRSHQGDHVERADAHGKHVQRSKMGIASRTSSIRCIVTELMGRWSKW